MAVNRITKSAGLWTSPSPLTAPLGSYLVADNCVISFPDIIEPRRGFEYLGYDLSSGGTVSIPKALFSFKGTLLAHHVNKVSYNSGVALVDFTNNYAAPNSQVLRMKMEEAGLNIYFTSDTGTQTIDSTANQPYPSGVLAAQAPTTVANPTALTGLPDAGWMPKDTKTAYVATWFRTDANDTDHEGTPSNPVFITNPADITVPAGAASKPGTVHTNQYVLITYPSHGFNVGDAVTITFDPADAQYVSGTFTVVRPWTEDSFYLKAGTITASGPTAHPATITSGSKNVQVSVGIPPYGGPFVQNALSGYSALIYRAKLSNGANVVPRSQYYLAKQYVITPADIAAGYITFTDSTPDSLLQDPLYTNTDDGEPPDSSTDNDDSVAPWCTDLAEFDDRLWGANYQEAENFSFSLLGVGAPNGLQVGDTITIAGAVFTAIAESATPTGVQFRVYSSSSSAGTNVQRTAQELALQVTQSGLNTDCYYTSDVDAIPGQMLLRFRRSGTSPFAISVSRVSAWGPDMTGGAVSSANAETNGLWFSKRNQPEAVPLLNRIQVGPRNARILRIRPLRDKLFAFTDIAGVYVVSNSYPYIVTQLGSTATLISPDTLVNFDDAIWGLTTQGVVRFTEAGVQVLSIPIEADIKALFGVGLPYLKQKSLAVGYESARKYCLAMPTDPSDTENTQAFVYDVATRAWTRWTKPMDAMVVLPMVASVATSQDYLYCTTPRLTTVSKERKNFDQTDYMDESFQVTVNSYSGQVANVTVASVSNVPLVGDLLYQTPILRSIVTAVSNPSSGVYLLTTQDTVDWTTGTAATVYTAIQTDVVYTPIFAGGPEERKNFREVSFHFRTPGFSLGQATFRGDTNYEEHSVPFQMSGFGELGWGSFSWAQPARMRNRRVSIPTPARRVSFLTAGFSLREAQGTWQLAGITPVFEEMSERNTK
jgi:hypothetical protein